MKRMILKCSGEAIGGHGKGIDLDRVNSLALEIKELLDGNDINLGIIVGGGNIWRGRDAHLSGMDRTHADYMGMMSTVLNAKALSNALVQIGIPSTVLSSFETPISEKYTVDKANECFKDGKVIVFGGGIGLPFFSTDTCAALRAVELNASLILMAKNGTDGVYSADPRKDSNAKRYDKITYSEIIHDSLGVMDLTACTLCMENNVDIIVFDMNVKGNIKKASIDYSIGTYITK